MIAAEADLTVTPGDEQYQPVGLLVTQGLYRNVILRFEMLRCTISAVELRLGLAERTLIVSDERKLVPVDPDYMFALGIATYIFARCEWQVVWCSEKICPGSVAKIVSEEMTAGKIGKHFANVVGNMPKSKERDELSLLASEFLTLVDERNRIIHGKPCIAPNGQQRLSGNGIVEISHLKQAADAFTVCSGKLNSFFYGFLQNYVPR